MPYPTLVNVAPFSWIESSSPAVGSCTGVTPARLASVITARSFGSVLAPVIPPKSGSVCIVPAISLDVDENCWSNVTQTCVTPCASSSAVQCAAVRNTVGAINEPEQNSCFWPFEFVAISAPVYGCEIPFVPSGAPYVIAPAAATSARAAASAAGAAHFHLPTCALLPDRRRLRSRLTVGSISGDRHPGSDDPSSGLILVN